MCSRWRGSMPLNGSSSSRIGGSWTSAPASLARWRMPFEYVPIGRSAASVRSTVAIARAAAASGSGDALEARVEPHELEPGQVRRGRPRAPGRARRGGTSRAGARRSRPRPGPGRPTARAGRPSGGAASTCRRRSGPSRPVTPGAERERDVVDGDDVAVPARDVVELERGRRRRGGAAAGGRGDGGGLRAVMSRSAGSAGWSARSSRRCRRPPRRGRPSPAGRATPTTGLSGIEPKIAAFVPSRTSPGLNKTTSRARSWLVRSADELDDDRRDDDTAMIAAVA